MSTFPGGRRGFTRNPYITKSQLKRSRIKRYGRVASARAERKREWEQDHPPRKTKQGEEFYFCHICVYFNEPPKVALVWKKYYVLEHITPKGRVSLDESNEDDNLAPAHKKCNYVKGSRTLEEMEQSPISNLPNPKSTERNV